MPSSFNCALSLSPSNCIPSISQAVNASRYLLNCLLMVASRWPTDSASKSTNGTASVAAGAAAGVAAVDLVYPCKRKNVRLLGGVIQHQQTSRAVKTDVKVYYSSCVKVVCVCGVTFDIESHRLAATVHSQWRYQQLRLQLRWLLSLQVAVAALHKKRV